MPCARSSRAGGGGRRGAAEMQEGAARLTAVLQRGIPDNPIDLIAALIAESKHWAGGGAMFNRFDVEPPFKIADVDRLIEWLRDFAKTYRKRKRAAKGLRRKPTNPQAVAEAARQ